MNIVEPTIEFCDYSGLRKIELIGKVCTKQEDSIKPDSAETFCRNRLIDGHTAIFEHEYVYFNVTSIPNRVVREFVKLSPYIRWSYLGNYIGFSYRVFLDIMSNSRKMKAIYNDIYHPSEVNDLFYNMLLLSKEFSHLLFDDKDITAKLEYGIDASLRIASDAEILANAPEIYNVTYKITTDRGVTHEAVRHREMSFMQESTRWCNYAKGRLGYKYGKNISVIEPPFKNEDSLEKFLLMMVNLLSWLVQFFLLLLNQIFIYLVLSICGLVNILKLFIPNSLLLRIKVSFLFVIIKLHILK